MSFEPKSLAACWGYRPTPGPVLVAGNKVYETSHDRRAIYREDGEAVIGVDMLEGEGVDIVHDLAEPFPYRVTHVDCCSVLEHCADPFAVARTLQDALHRGGTILFSVPFVWRVHAYPSDYWRFTTEGVRLLFPQVEWQRLRYTYADGDGEHFAVNKKEKGRGLLPKCEIIGWGTKR